MREKRPAQASIYKLFANHDLGCELQTISEWLDAHREILTPVKSDLYRHGLKSTGRRGLSAETVLRCAVLKAYVHGHSTSDVGVRSSRADGDRCRDPYRAGAAYSN